MVLSTLTAGSEDLRAAQKEQGAAVRKRSRLRISRRHAGQPPEVHRGHVPPLALDLGAEARTRLGSSRN